MFSNPAGMRRPCMASAIAASFVLSSLLIQASFEAADEAECEDNESFVCYCENMYPTRETGVGPDPPRSGEPDALDRPEFVAESSTITSRLD